MFRFAVTTGFAPSNADVISGLLERGWRPALVVIQRPRPRNVSFHPRSLVSRLLAPPGYASLGEYRYFRKIRKELAGGELGGARDFYVGFDQRLRALRLRERSPAAAVRIVEDINRDVETHRLLADMDLLLVLGGAILKPRVFTAPKVGTFNLHDALLPMLRGAGPIQEILLAYRCGDLSGITLHQVDGGMDTGAIVGQVRVPPREGESASGLFIRTYRAGIDLFQGLLERVSQGQAPVMMPQDGSQACYVKQIELPKGPGSARR